MRAISTVVYFFPTISKYFDATGIGKIRFKLDYGMKTKELEVCKQGGALHMRNQGIKPGSGGSEG